MIRNLWLLAMASLGLACEATPVVLELPDDPTAQAVVVVTERTLGDGATTLEAAAFDPRDGSGSDCLPKIAFSGGDATKSLRFDVRVYDQPLAELCLTAGCQTPAADPASGRPLPRADAEYASGVITGGGTVRLAAVSGAGPLDFRGQRCGHPPEAIVQLAAGSLHGCVVLASGAVRCWGGNTHGQLGDGSIIARASPIPVPFLSGWPVAQLALGWYHTCALGTDGAVRCWGDNVSGQIGEGSPGGDQLTPVAVSLPRTAIQIAAGGSHTCAILDDASLWCWGSFGDSLDQVSDGPVAVPGAGATDGGGALLVSLGVGSSCVVRRDQSVACFGRNYSGDLGVDAAGANTATVVPGLPRIAEIALGDRHVCARSSTSADVWCWGWNHYDQLGQPVDGLLSSVAPVRVEGGIPATPSAIVSGGSRSCALVGTTPYCWGQLFSSEARPAAALDGLRVVRVALGVGENDVIGGPLSTMSTGRGHACVELDDGSVRCWQHNEFGQSGSGSADPSFLDAPVPLSW
jgi:hypothetical protein